MSAELQGKVAIVTGGASGIGAATVRLLARNGASVLIADVQDDAGAALSRAIGPAAAYVRHDVADEASWKALCAGTIERFGRLDVLVNNAGVSGGLGDIETTTLEQWDRVHAVNLDGVFLGCKHAIAAMRRTSAAKPASKGAIVNVSSIAGLVGAAGPCAYTASKGAVRLLTKSVALWCAAQKLDIRCNSLHPGGVDTPIFDNLYKLVGADAARAYMGSRHPLGRMADPKEMAEAILFLASDRASFVTGAELTADGGVTAALPLPAPPPLPGFPARPS